VTLKTLEAANATRASISVKTSSFFIKFEFSSQLKNFGDATTGVLIKQGRFPNPVSDPRQLWQRLTRWKHPATSQFLRLLAMTGDAQRADVVEIAFSPALDDSNDVVGIP